MSPGLRQQPGPDLQADPNQPGPGRRRHLRSHDRRFPASLPVARQSPGSGRRVAVETPGSCQWATRPPCLSRQTGQRSPWLPCSVVSQPECHGASHGQSASSVMIVPFESETDSGRRCGSGGQNGCHGFGLGALQKMVLGRRRAMVAGPSPSQLSGV